MIVIYLMMITILVAFVSQVIIPLNTGKPLFGWFRGPTKKMDGEGMLKEASNLHKQAKNSVETADNIAAADIEFAEKELEKAKDLKDKTTKILKKS